MSSTYSDRHHRRPPESLTARALSHSQRLQHNSTSKMSSVAGGHGLEEQRSAAAEASDQRRAGNEAAAAMGGSVARNQGEVLALSRAFEVVPAGWDKAVVDNADCHPPMVAHDGSTMTGLAAPPLMSREGTVAFETCLRSLTDHALSYSSQPEVRP
jgi:hypothetical protein